MTVKEKMSPIKAMFSELKRHCGISQSLIKSFRENEKVFRPEALRQFMMREAENWHSFAIGSLCDLIEITEIPKEEIPELLEILNGITHNHARILSIKEMLQEQLN